MEQSNYNRGSYGRGGRGGGGGPGGGGGRGGGREGGRGGGGGRGRGGGSSRGGGGGVYGGGGNYRQAYNNQRQEQYGGGRGRSGGVDRQPKVNYVDPAPGWVGSDPGVRNWSRVVSGQPQAQAQSQGLVEVQTRVSDLRIQEVPGAEVRDISSTKEKMDVVENAADAYMPIKRPDHGTLASRSIRLLVNHFPIKFDPSNTILRYDVDVKQEDVKQDDAASSTRPVKKKISKPLLRKIQEKLCSDYPDVFPLLMTAYDGEKNIFSAVTLRPGNYKVELFGKVYSFTVKFGNELMLSKLQDYLHGNATQLPRDMLQALDVVMKANLFREKVSVGRGMYPRVHRDEDDLYYCGVAGFRGSQQSLKLTSNGLVVSSDYSAMPFRKRMPVMDFLRECICDIRGVSDIARFRSRVIEVLKGLMVTVTHRRTKQKYAVAGLTEKLTRAISFKLEDPESEKKPEEIMITTYFREKWDQEIVHLDIPCLVLGHGKKPNYVPMEFCILAEDRRFPKEELGKEAARKLKDLCLLPPDFRRGEICNMVREEYGTRGHGAEVIRNFDIEVDTNMTTVDGRVMPPPKLKLGTLSGKVYTTMVDKYKCHWNLLSGKTLVAGKAAERWALIDFSADDRWNRLNVKPFITKLMNRCRSLGVHMEDPIVVHQTNMHEFSDVNRLGNLLSGIVDEASRRNKGKLQIIVCVMADKDDGYNRLKWVSETKIGVITQCCLSKAANRANDQYLANLGMKINAKLGGSNVELIDPLPHFHGDDHFMFIGADVNHPAPSNKSSPSIAAVVGSVNWPAATRYAARVSPQPHRKEEIVNFGNLCLDLVNAYARLNGVKPNKIVVFRDGVSDAQFDMVLNKEMVELKKAIYNKHYRPAITFVVAQKRHTTRLFLTDGRDSGNVPPGTVVDTVVVHPFEFDFYLCSHFGGLGTSKPTHYTVIWDENGFSSNQIQKLIYDMCFTFARCTKPVSLVPPVYYADLVAYRGRMYQEVVAEFRSPGSVSSSSSKTSASSSSSVLPSSSFSQFFYDLEHHLKDSMFFV